MVVVVGMFLGACGESKQEAPGGGAMPSAAPVAPAAGGAPAAVPIPNASVPAELVGTWTRTLTTFDENANDALDAAEHEDANMPTMGYAALELAADGTCTVTRKDKAGADVAVKASCDATELDGKPALQIEPPPSGEDTPMTYRILSSSSNELILKDPTGANGSIYRYTR